MNTNVFSITKFIINIDVFVVIDVKYYNRYVKKINDFLNDFLLSMSIKSDLLSLKFSNFRLKFFVIMMILNDLSFDKRELKFSIEKFSIEKIFVVITTAILS